MTFFTYFFLSLVVVYSTSVESAKLQSYNVNSDLVSVSGFSSGAFFAVQFHVAFSKDVVGVGAVGGGPYWCAQNGLSIAVNACTIFPELISVPELVNITYTVAQSLKIDDPSNMKNDRVYLFSSINDSVVRPGVVRKLEEYYKQFTMNIESQFSLLGEHAVVTNDYGNSCDALVSPFINNCNYSTAFYLLNQIYNGDVNKALSSSAKEENLMEFDQTEFGAVENASLDSTGYIYVPSNCRSKQKQCRLHISFHGCNQGRVFVSDAYARHAGFNEMAEENDIIMLYPQATRSFTAPLNPSGCWDLWGYTSSDYANKDGIQMAQVRAMMDRLIMTSECRETLHSSVIFIFVICIIAINLLV